MYLLELPSLANKYKNAKFIISLNIPQFYNSLEPTVREYV